MFDNRRRVTKQALILHDTDLENQSTIKVACADSMYGANVLDGKIKVMNF